MIGGKKADGLESPKPKEQILSSLGFLFGSRVVNLELKKETPWKNKGTQTKTYSNKGLGKGQLN